MHAYKPPIQAGTLEGPPPSALPGNTSVSRMPVNRSPSRKRLLFVTDVFPFPFDRGQRVRVYNLLAACGRAFDTTFVGPPPDDDEALRGEVERLCRRAVFLAPPPQDWRERVSLLARTARIAPGLPKPATLRQYEPYVRALEEARIDEFDLVWAERLHIARLCTAQRPRTILDLDDLEHVKAARLLRLQRAPRDVARNAYRYAVYRRGELSWSRQCLAAVVCSDEDREYLERHGVRNTLTVPNGVNLPLEWSPSSVRRFSVRTSLRVVFLGNVGYEPNADAIAFFADEVLPELRKRVPNVTFDVIGPGASPEFVSRYESRVRFRGFVADLDSAFAEYDVLAAPIRYGSGTKLKVLDAMAHRIPLVTSAVGAEGLSLKPGEHALIASSASDFVESIVRIHNDKDLAFRLVAAAQALVRDRFSWDAITGNLVDWLGRLEVSPLDRAPTSISGE